MSLCAISEVCMIQWGNCLVVAIGAYMTATAGQLIHKALSLPQQRSISQSKMNVFTFPQLGMGNALTFRSLIATMAITAAAELLIMSWMAGQTKLGRLTSPYRNGCNKHGENHYTRDQLVPLKNIAIMVSSMITAVSITAGTETAHCSRGNQQAL